VASGQFELRRARDVYFPDGRFDADRTLAALHAEHERACADGYTGLSMTGEVPDEKNLSNPQDQANKEDAALDKKIKSICRGC